MVRANNFKNKVESFLQDNQDGKVLSVKPWC